MLFIFVGTLNKRVESISSVFEGRNALETASFETK